MECIDEERVLFAIAEYAAREGALRGYLHAVDGGGFDSLPVGREFRKEVYNALNGADGCGCVACDVAAMFAPDIPVSPLYMAVANAATVAVRNTLDVDALLNQLCEDDCAATMDAVHDHVEKIASDMSRQWI